MKRRYAASERGTGRFIELFTANIRNRNPYSFSRLDPAGDNGYRKSLRYTFPARRLPVTGSGAQHGFCGRERSVRAEKISSKAGPNPTAEKLHEAAESGDLQTVRALLTRRA
jgi:hypothetical protein